jgi:hypothetical protein
MSVKRKASADVDGAGMGERWPCDDDHRISLPEGAAQHGAVVDRSLAQLVVAV